MLPGLLCKLQTFDEIVWKNLTTGRVCRLTSIPLFQVCSPKIFFALWIYWLPSRISFPLVRICGKLGGGKRVSS